MPIINAAVVLTAIQAETEAVLRHLENCSAEQVESTWFHVGHFGAWTVAVAEVGSGNAAAATIAMRAFTHFKPEIAAFVGVAGGLKDVALGDVVVATKVYGYESGKETPSGFQPRPAVQNSHHELQQRARVIRASANWQARLASARKSNRKPAAHVGPIAAGEAVVADDAGRIATQLKQLYGDALAVEMEGRGFLEAAHVDSGCRAVVVRGISDRLTGKAASDRRGWQQRAADSAATFFFEMLALEAGSAQLNQTYSKQAAQSSSPEPQPPFPNAQPKDGPARFRSPGEALGIRDGAGLLDASAGTSISFAPSSAIWLRVMPAFDLGKQSESYELRDALNKGINLPTLLGPANGTYTLRAEDGVGSCILPSGCETQTSSVAFAFKTGEVWAVDTFSLATNPEDLFVFEIERMLTERLPGYGRFLMLLGLKPPYQWIAGVTEVQNRRIRVPPPRGRMNPPWSPSQLCIAKHVISDGVYNAEQSPISSLLPFFKAMYEACGIRRPEYLGEE
jgi:nucleoside phosphorylase